VTKTTVFHYLELRSPVLLDEVALCRRFFGSKDHTHAVTDAISMVTCSHCLRSVGVHRALCGPVNVGSLGEPVENT
jgi:hypothetical protein